MVSMVLSSCIYYWLLLVAYHHHPLRCSPASIDHPAAVSILYLSLCQGFHWSRGHFQLILHPRLGVYKQLIYHQYHQLTMSLSRPTPLSSYHYYRRYKLSRVAALLSSLCSQLHCTAVTSMVMLMLSAASLVVQDHRFPLSPSMPAVQLVMPLLVLVHQCCRLCQPWLGLRPPIPHAANTLAMVLRLSQPLYAPATLLHAWIRA